MGRNPAQSNSDQRLIGRTIAGRYSLVRLLGDGGMGAVYKAEDNVLRRFVALKLLHPAAAANPAAVERFLREAQAAASIGHPNIIDILDFGEADGKPYLVMEYLRGRSLADVLQTDGPLDMKHACAVATHALAGLQGAHDRGILHRDLKPANLMLVMRFGDRSFVKLLDFGFAALLGGNLPSDKTLTPARTLVGTPAYAAPERLRGDDRRDPRTDLYSLGVVLYEMLAGVRPFDAGTFSELARKAQTEPPPSLRLYRPETPEGLERVILRALAKTPEERWPDAESFAAALVPFGGRVVDSDPEESDSLAMDLIKIRARDKKREGVPSNIPPEALERRAPAREAKASFTRPDSADLELARMSLDVEAPVAQRKASLRDAPMAQPPLSARAPEGALRQRRTPDAALPARPLSSPPPRGPQQPLDERLFAETTRTAPNFRSSLPPPAVKAREVINAPHATAQQAGVASPTGVSGERKRPTTPATSAPAAPAAPATPVARPQRAFDGSVGLSILRFVSRRYGERALKMVLDSLPPETLTVFTAGVAPNAFISFDSVCQLVEAIDAKLGRDDLHLIADCGRAVAEGTFDQMKRLSSPTPPPELLLAEMPGFVEKLIRGVRCKVRSVGRGYGRLELDEPPGTSSLTMCVLVLGFLDRSLGRFGAREVEVNLLNCRYLGDDENLYDISWLIT
jgi:serine/threonine protein kinase